MYVQGLYNAMRSTIGQLCIGVKTGRLGNEKIVRMGG